MRRHVCRSLGLLAVLSAVSAWAQPTVSAPAPAAAPDGSLFELRLRYGAAIRSGSETPLGPELSYSGVTPNDLALSGWTWFLLSRHLGLTATLQREAFSLYDGDTKVVEGGLLRATAAPTGRVRLGPVTLEAAAGYSFSQLPVFGSANAPTFSSVSRHGVLLAARGLVDVGPVTVEGRFEVPLVLATSISGASSSGLAAAGAVRVNLFRTGALRWGILAEAAWNSDSLTAPDLSVSQSVVRVGGAIDLKWEEEKVVAKYGRVHLKVSGAGAPVAGAKVTLSVNGTRREVPLDPMGQGEALDLPPGQVVASVEAPGFLPSEQQVEVAAGQDAALTFSLDKEPPKVGALRVLVVNKVGGAAIPTAVVELNGRRLTVDANGAVVIPELPLGPVALKVTAPGFNPGEEAASVVGGQTSELQVNLVPEKKRLPATVTGVIRNARGGKPVVATLEIKELKLKLTADADGRFQTEIPGGTYTAKISAPNFIPQTKSVTVRDGDQAIFNVELYPR